MSTNHVLIYICCSKRYIGLPSHCCIPSVRAWTEQDALHPWLRKRRNLALVRDKMEGAFRLSHKNFVNDIEDLKDRARDFNQKVTFATCRRSWINCKCCEKTWVLYSTKPTPFKTKNGCWAGRFPNLQNWLESRNRWSLSSKCGWARRTLRKAIANGCMQMCLIWTWSPPSSPFRRWYVPMLHVVDKLEAEFHPLHLCVSTPRVKIWRRFPRKPRTGIRNGRKTKMPSNIFRFAARISSHDLSLSSLNSLANRSRQRSN